MGDIVHKCRKVASSDVQFWAKALCKARTRGSRHAWLQQDDTFVSVCWIPGPGAEPAPPKYRTTYVLMKTCQKCLTLISPVVRVEGASSGQTALMDLE